MSLNIPQANPLSENLGPRVVPKSMESELKPDTEGLPPAGHSRDEVMRQRRDALEEAIAQMPEDRGGIDVSDIEIENELAHAFDDLGNLPISRKNPEYEYKWKRPDESAKALWEKIGFEVVTGDPRVDPKCPNWEGLEYLGKGLYAAGTTVRGHGDVILVRIKQHRYELWENYLRKMQIQRGDVESNFQYENRERAMRAGLPPSIVHGEPQDPLIQRVFANGPTQSAAMDRMMRQGSLPGATTTDMFRR